MYLHAQMHTYNMHNVYMYMYMHTHTSPVMINACQCMRVHHGWGWRVVHKYRASSVIHHLDVVTVLLQ